MMNKPMELKLKRIIIFANDVVLLTGYYKKMFGIKDGYIAGDKKWGELYSGGISIAFHKGINSGSKEGSPKLVFYAKDVVKVRTALIAKGADMGKVIKAGELELSNGKDPEGNVFQISNRK